MTHFELGVMGERYVATILHNVGLAVEMGGPADLVVEGVPVEVKAARPSRRGSGRRPGYQFSLRRVARSGKIKTDVRRSALTVLLCYPSDGDRPIGEFVIPTEALGERRHILISSPRPWQYTGQWSGYLGAWESAARVIEGGNLCRS